jgi:hypothetical protein
MTPRDPDHYLRFARALALVSLATAPGCYLAHERPTDAGPQPDAFVADTGPVNTCSTCMCAGNGPMPPPDSCEGRGLWQCCATLGPLAPPDLPA